MKREKAILAIVKKLGRVTPLCNSAEAEFHEQQAIANGRRKAWESLQKQMQGICTELASVENGGEYQPDLLDRVETAKPSEGIKPPHPEVHQEGGAKSDKPVETQALKDEGGELKLAECLLRKTLVKLCGDECQAEGLTAGKIDDLISACEGKTLADLEKWQREKPSWNRDIKGFGDKWVDRLQDAHSALRAKFPIPTGPAPEAPKAADTKPAESAIVPSAVAAGDKTLDVPAVNPEAPK